VYTLEADMTVSVKEARRKLGKLVESAARGERIDVTRRGRKVARIVPAEPDGKRALPDLAEFRRSISIDGGLSAAVIAQRQVARY
jgi:prevent-host-death family protein